jgi:LuxR family transcriptional regulator, maltose regulon positive regulatory protein
VVAFGRRLLRGSDGNGRIRTVSTGETVAGSGVIAPALGVPISGSSTLDTPAEVVIARVKLAPPVPRSPGRLIDRTHLVQQLEAGLATRLTLVSAPTGWGKTTLISQWARASDAEFVWVSLDPGDDDPLRFWRCVALALAAARRDASPVALRRLRSPVVSVSDEILPALVNDLADIGRPLVLVIDDYQLITDPRVHEQMEYLLARLPLTMHVVVVAGIEPALRLGRARAMGEVVDVGLSQLRFSDAEATALLNGVHGLELVPAEVASVQERVEGWASGLNLVALAMRRRGEPRSPIETLPIDDAHLSRYLWDEVVAAQPAHVRDFLMRTALVERFSASLADALTGRSDGARTAQALERANLFVLPLDESHTCFRYHHLLRRVLLAHLQEEHPETVGELHRRASDWYAAHDRPIAAIDHLLAGGDPMAAAAAIERQWLRLYADGQLRTLVEWIDGLPAAAIAEHPILALVRAGLARGLGQTEEIDRWLARVPASAARTPVPGLASSVEGAIAGLRSVYRLAVGDVAGAIACGRRARELEPVPGSRERAYAGHFLGVALFFEDPDLAVPLLEEFLAVTPCRDRDTRHRYAMALLAERHALRGELAEAQRLADGAVESARRMGLDEYPSMNQLHVAAGAVCLASGDIDDAEEQFERAVRLAGRGRDRVEMAHAFVWLAAARSRHDDAHAAARAFADARTLVPGVGESSMRGLVGQLFATSPTAPRQPAPSQVEAISAAERRVLALMPGDLTYREIAGQLYLSYNTVRTHARQVLRKLDASSRAQAVARARDQELL